MATNKQYRVFGKFTRRGPGLPRYSQSQELTKKIVRQRLTGMDMDKIAAKHGVTQQAVSWRIHDFVKMNPKSPMTKQLIENKLIRFKQTAVSA